MTSGFTAGHASVLTLQGYIDVHNAVRTRRDGRSPTWSRMPWSAANRNSHAVQTFDKDHPGQDQERAADRDDIHECDLLVVAHRQEVMSQNEVGNNARWEQ